MKTILVELDAGILENGLLACAVDLARAFSAQIVGLHVAPLNAYVSMDPFGSVYALPVLLEAAREEEQKIREAFEAAMANEDIPWEYRSSSGIPSSEIAEQSRFVDVVMVAKPGGSEQLRRRMSYVGELALTSSAPILALPVESRSFDPFGRAIIAWNGSPEASAAVRAALPMLALASDVTVLTVNEPDGKWNVSVKDFEKYLTGHGINASTENIAARDGDLPSSLLRAVADRQAAYLVMGAYGRSRAREWLLGGVTRHMLLNLPAPLLLAH